MNQKSVASLDAPDMTDYGDMNITPVNLKTGEDDYLAVMKTENFADVTILLIYKSDRTLIYEEVLSKVSLGLLAVDLDGDGVDSLLVGTDGAVIKYDYTG